MYINFYNVYVCYLICICIYCCGYEIVFLKKNYDLLL